MSSVNTVVCGSRGALSIRVGDRVVQRKVTHVENAEGDMKMSGIKGNERSVVDSTGVAEAPRCSAVNPLEKAWCQLRAGHEGLHWGHGPHWEWSDDNTVVRIVGGVPEGER